MNTQIITPVRGGDKSRSDPPHARPAPRVGDVRVTKGRHAGKRLADCPPDYLAWLVANSACSTYRLAAAELLGIKADPAAAPQNPRPAARDRDGGKPTALTDDHVNEILGVLFKLADELDAVADRVRELEERERVLVSRLDRAEVALEHLGFDLDVTEPEMAGVA